LDGLPREKRSDGEVRKEGRRVEGIVKE